MSEIKVGDKVHVLWGKDWIDGEVLQVTADQILVQMSRAGSPLTWRTIAKEGETWRI